MLETSIHMKSSLLKDTIKCCTSRSAAGENTQYLYILPIRWCPHRFLFLPPRVQRATGSEDNKSVITQGATDAMTLDQLSKEGAIQLLDHTESCPVGAFRISRRSGEMYRRKAIPGMRALLARERSISEHPLLAPPFNAVQHGVFLLTALYAHDQHQCYFLR